MDEHHHAAAKLPLPSSIPCDQCSGSMHRQDRVFVCERCGRTLTVSTVAKLLPRPDLTEG
jgi:Zn finger protein HypA/HybF involved in hydrogenase expression